MAELRARVVEEARFIREMFGFVYVSIKEDLRADISHVWSIVVGSAELRGETCHLKGCERQSVGTYPHPDDWRDDLETCRRHYLLLHVTIKLIQGLIVAAIIGIGIAPWVLLA